ncbi:MAG: hypothetical protein ABGX84_06610 [Alcanivorax sp.]
MAEQQRERDIAEMEAQMAHDTDQYFEARPQIMRTRDKETTFEAGFKAAWAARPLSHAEGEAVDLEIGAGDVLICDLGTASAAGVAFYRDNAAHDVGTHHPELSGMGGTELAGRIFSVMTEKPESLVVLYNAVGRALATLGHPAPHAEGEAFGWFTEDHDTDKSATTYDPVVADRWRKKGWPVWPLYTHPAPQVAGLTETAIKSSPAYRALHREKEHLLGLLKDQAPQVAVPEGYALVPEDMLTHFRDFHDAVRTLSKTADPDGYWEHQCEVCKRIESQLAAAPTAPAAPAGELRPDCSVCGDFGSDCGVCGAPSRQLVSDPDGLPGAKGYWLKDSGYGVDDHFDTLDEALSSASSLIEDYRTEAGADEWPSDADSITISAVTHVARFVHVRDNEYDLRMEAAAPAPDEREIAALALERHADNLIVMAERDGRNSDRESQQTWEEAAYFAKQEAARLRAGKEGEPS